MAIPFMQRCKMAWWAFRCKPFEVDLLPYKKVGTIPDLMSVKCDNHYRTGCNNKQEVALEKFTAEFRVRWIDSYFLCRHCANDAENTYKKLP